MVEDTPKVYKLQEIGDGFTAVYDVEDTYVEAGQVDEEDKHYLMPMPLSVSLPWITPPPKKQATIFEKFTARLASFLVKKEEKVNIVVLDMETDVGVIVVA